MTLQELAQRQSDFFALLDLSPGYQLDLALMRKNYLSFSRLTHPDFYATRPELLALALEVSATLNEACRTLENPLLRAEYLLQRHGGKSSGEDKRVAPEILQQTLMLREEIEEAGEDRQSLQALRGPLEKQKQDALDRIATLARQLLEEGRPARTPTLDALRLELNGIKYVVNLLGQLRYAG